MCSVHVTALCKFGCITDTTLMRFMDWHITGCIIYAHFICHNMDWLRLLWIMGSLHTLKPLWEYGFDLSLLPYLVSCKACKPLIGWPGHYLLLRASFAHIDCPTMSAASAYTQTVLADVTHAHWMLYTVVTIWAIDMRGMRWRLWRITTSYCNYVCKHTCFVIMWGTWMMAIKSKLWLLQFIFSNVFLTELSCDDVCTSYKKLDTVFT